MADEFSAHLAPAVFRLCWSRRYVFIPHGCGVTPVAQTPDTDLHQWVKREYTDGETSDLLRQMRDGTVVPQLRQEGCIDIMVDVLSNTALHLNAARGYLRTGMTVDLDGLQDQEIVREAGAFWTELGMRTNIIPQSRIFGRNTTPSDSAGTWRISNASSGHTRKTTSRCGP